MEKKQPLDAGLKTIILILFAGFLVSCSLPRIHVLHDPLSPQEHLDLGLSYEKRGDFDAALQEYKIAAKERPASYLYIGNVCFQQKKFNEAEKAYQKAIAQTQNPDAYNNLAWLYYETDTKLDEAEALARKAIELSPVNEQYADTLSKIKEKRRP